MCLEFIELIYFLLAKIHNIYKYKGEKFIFKINEEKNCWILRLIKNDISEYIVPYKAVFIDYI